MPLARFHIISKCDSCCWLHPYIRFFMVVLSSTQPPFLKTYTSYNPTQLSTEDFLFELNSPKCQLTHFSGYRKRS
nr:MAG TPA: hypothetical protein [Caudoviricetes sp.]